VYGNGFLSWGFTDRHEILHDSSATSRTGLLPFGRIAPVMAKFWASIGAIWRDMLLAEALVCRLSSCCLSLYLHVTGDYYSILENTFGVLEFILGNTVGTLVFGRWNDSTDRHSCGLFQVAEHVIRLLSQLSCVYCYSLMIDEVLGRSQ